MRARWTTVIGAYGLPLWLLVTACGDRGNEPATPPQKIHVPSGVPRNKTVQAPASIRDRLRVEPVTAHLVPEVVTAPGEVSLDLKQVALITSRLEGQVQTVLVQLGDHVRRNQPLLSIESMRLDELVQEYLVTKAQADVAESGYKRTEKLWTDQIVSERRLVEERGRNLEASARHQHVREKLLNMGMTAEELHQLEHGSHQEGHRYTVKSPIAGTVIAQNVVRGQGVTPGNELFEIVDTSRVWVFANLPIEQARKFKEGDLGTILPRGGKPVTAPLTYLSPVADETTRTIRVRLEVANPQQYLKPREYVDVQLTLAGSPVLAVPVSSLTMVENVRAVFVQRETGFAFVPITVGREGGGFVEVKSGLTTGDHVVVDGVFDLKNVLLKEHIGSGEGG